MVPDTRTVTVVREAAALWLLLLQDLDARSSAYNYTNRMSTIYIIPSASRAPKPIRVLRRTVPVLFYLLSVGEQLEPYRSNREKRVRAECLEKSR